MKSKLKICLSMQLKKYFDEENCTKTYFRKSVLILYRCMTKKIQISKDENLSIISVKNYQITKQTIVVMFL